MTADDGPCLERQMGCMAGIFHHLFDRSYIPSSRRFVSPKSLLLPASDDMESSVSPSEKSDAFVAEQSATAAVKAAAQQWRNLEASRLSLDSRAVTDAKGKLHRRSPGAVARLMGLEALPDQDNANPKRSHVLRRSSSDSRARTDPSFYRFVDATAFQKVPVKEKKQRNNSSIIQRKGFELFPAEQPPVPVSLYGEIERRLRVRGIEEPAKDLETLKQVLDAVQLKGLLHSKPSDGHDRSPNSPVVLMKPAASKPSRSPRRDLKSDRPQLQARRCTDGSRRGEKNEVRRATDRRLSPVGSPVGSPRKVAPNSGTVRLVVSDNNSRRREGNVVQRGISAGTGTRYNRRTKSTSKYGWEEERTGRNILERCDELLYSIAAITATDQNSSEDPQPSPVSVLDSLFHTDECSPPSPKTKRSLHFQDQLFDWTLDQQSNDEMSTVGSDCSDPDYMFVAEIMRSSDRCQDSSKLFASLEKHPKFGATDHTPMHHRRLLYDLVREMLNRGKHHVPPWEASKCHVQIQMPDIDDVWQRIQQLKEPIIITNKVVADVISVAISKDMAADRTWSCPSVELSDAVLQIERMIFKDLVADSITALTDVASASSSYHHPRRKLIF